MTAPWWFWRGCLWLRWAAWMAYAWCRWGAVRVGYWGRPYDMIADARRWRWQARQRCGWFR